MVYYDLIASLPHLPYFEHAERLPITPLRLSERLRLLRPAHAEQLARAQSLLRWRPDRFLERGDAQVTAAYADLRSAGLDRSLRGYVAFRTAQQTLLAALRVKRRGLGVPDGPAPWGVGPWVHYVRDHWDETDFGLAHLYPWLPQALRLLDEGDALALEGVLMSAAWGWLDGCAATSMFSFAAVFCYFFKWDILQAWCACDAQVAKARFSDLIDKVTHVEDN